MDSVPTQAIAEGISIIVPTFRERENIPHLLTAISAMRQKHGLTLEVLIMDDASNDGSVETVKDAGFDWAQIIVREDDHGLSPAVIDGFQRARYPYLVCMDADLSHPVDSVPQLILGLQSGQQFMIGSRYVTGGTTDDDWGIGRWLNSVLATILARPLTSVRDPMSGFFALRKADFDRADELNPVGYKIGLELIVKCGFDNVGEVPIHFTDRVHGESKLTLKEQLKYIRHLRRLYIHKFANSMYLAQFAVVGGSGVVVNLAILSLLLSLGASDAIALAAGIGVSLLSNFLLNRRFTFDYARDQNMGRQFIGFLGASAVGFAVNYSVALFMLKNVLTDWSFSAQLAAITGILAGSIFNFLGNRFVVFRKKYIRK